MERAFKKALYAALGISSCIFAQNRPKLRPTGQVLQYSQAEYATLNTGLSNQNYSPIPLLEEDLDSVQTATGRSYAVEIVHVSDTSVPSLAADLNNSLMSTELVAQLEGEYRRELRDYYTNYNFYLSRRDTRGARPYGMSSEQDAAFRHRMAKRSSKYMLMKGIPNFLKSRPDTRDMGTAADNAVAFAEKAATFQLSTKSGWSYNGGFNPLEWKTFVRMNNDLWSVDCVSSIQTQNRPYPWSKTNPLRVALGRQMGTYRVEARYQVWAKYSELAMDHAF